MVHRKVAYKDFVALMPKALGRLSLIGYFARSASLVALYQSVLISYKICLYRFFFIFKRKGFRVFSFMVELRIA